ncbi:MAG: penicillin-binding protein 2 [Anaerolineales bacterium]
MDSPYQNTLETWRITLFTIVIGLVFFVFVGQLFRLQILQGPAFLDLAENNRTDPINVPTARGNIYDRNGIPLALNTPAYNIVITPASLPDDDGEIQEIFRELSSLAGVPVNLGVVDDNTPFSPCVSEHGISQIVKYGTTTSPFRPVEIKCDVGREIAMVAQEKAMDWPGVSVAVESVRDYPTGELTAAIIGFLGPIPARDEALYRSLGFIPGRDKVGYAGVEYWFNDQLAGQNGIREVEVDVAGQVLRTLNILQEQAPGLNLTLTIDTRLQGAATTIVEQELNFWNTFLGRTLSNNAVAIAMNPQTGEILAMVSIPTYENNRFARLIPTYYYEQLVADLRLPLFNHAISAEHPPGSVFKLSTAVGALNEGVVTPDQIIDTPPKITVEEKFFAADFNKTREFVDWYDPGFGQLDFVHGVSNSSNVYFYKIGGGYRNEVPEGLGICRLGAYARVLGYGNATGIELPGEEDGLIPDPKWKRINRGENWSTGNTYNASVGQGFINATPLQVLLSGATIANNGRLMFPAILREIVDGEGNVIRPFVPQAMWDVTVDPVVEEFVQYVSGSGSCQKTGNWKTVQPWVIEQVQTGMRLAVTEGTLRREFTGFAIAAAGKTGTAEYCDNFAQAKDLCKAGNWPTHAWTIAYAPFDNPEIVVVAFVYNGGEGASVAGPIVRKILQAYFEIRALDTATGSP